MNKILTYKNYPHIFFSTLLAAIKEEVPFIGKTKLKDMLIATLVDYENGESLIENHIMQTTPYSVGFCNDFVQERGMYLKQDVSDFYTAIDGVLIDNGFNYGESIFIDFD